AWLAFSRFRSDAARDFSLEVYLRFAFLGFWGCCSGGVPTAEFSWVPGCGLSFCGASTFSVSFPRRQKRRPRVIRGSRRKAPNSSATDNGPRTRDVPKLFHAKR